MERGRLYAVGIVGPTYFPEDGRRSAADEARKELARSISVKVESILVDIERSHGPGLLGEAGIVSASSWATDVVINGSQILEYWVDENGLVPHGQKGATYALVVLGLGGIPGALEEQAKATLPPEEAKTVRERAEQAFQEMEKEKER